MAWLEDKAFCLNTHFRWVQGSRTRTPHSRLDDGRSEKNDGKDATRSFSLSSKTSASDVVAPPGRVGGWCWWACRLSAGAAGERVAGSGWRPCPGAGPVPPQVGDGARGHSRPLGSPRGQGSVRKDQPCYAHCSSSSIGSSGERRGKGCLGAGGPLTRYPRCPRGRVGSWAASWLVGRSVLFKSAGRRASLML